MLQKLPVNNFESNEDISQFNEDFRRKYNEENDKGYLLQVDFQYILKHYMNSIMIYHFYHSE